MSSDCTLAVSLPQGLRITPREAWAVSRVLTGRDGADATEAAPFMPLATALAALPLDERRSALSDALDGRADAGEIAEAIGAADPTGPAPAPGESGDWGELRIAEPIEAAPFPLAALPGPLARLSIEGARSITCPPDYIAAPGLAVAAGAIGRSVSLLLSESYFAHASLYLVNVGEPGSGRSHAQNLAGEPIQRITAAYRAEFERDNATWERELEEAVKTKTKPARRKPVLRQIWIDDTTTECLIGLWKRNPRGLVMVKDELGSLFTNMNAYRGGAGADRLVYTTGWSGQPINRNRVGDGEPIHDEVPHPCLSITGGLPIELLPVMEAPGGADDGLRDRFLFSIPEPLPAPEALGKGVPKQTRDDWASLIARLHVRGLAPNPSAGGTDVPHVMYFDRRGREAFNEWFGSHGRALKASSFPPYLKGPWAKLREYMGRFILVSALMRQAADPTADASALPRATELDVANAGALLEYFKSHCKRSHDHDNHPRGGRGRARAAILDLLRAWGKPSFAERDIKQARPWIGPDELASALDDLRRRNAVRPFPAPPRNGKPGRPSSPRYALNPALLAGGGAP